MNRRNPLLPCWLLVINTSAADPVIDHDPERRQVVMSDAAGNLTLRLSYADRCVLDQVTVGGRNITGAGPGVSSGIKQGDRWFTTRTGIVPPHVAIRSNSVTVSGIRFGSPGMEVSEVWRFTVNAEAIVWRIDREYLSSGGVEDAALPSWQFESMPTWTGGLLGHGGVAWGKLFDLPNASYGAHNGNVTFWNKGERGCLRILASSPSGSELGVRYTREPTGAFSCNYSLSAQAPVPKHGLARFRQDRQDIWRPFEVTAGRVSVEFTLTAPDYDDAYDRGVLKGVDGAAIREICHTIGRIGAIDELIMGSNGYYSGFAVLHEPWLAQLGLAINDPEYHRAFGETLDFQRRHAIGSDGRVKSRWAGQPGDEIPGTYDSFGFYECQWGWLMDSQTSWVINVAEQFDFTGDRAWLEQQKRAGEKVLDYLLLRDTDGDGLVEMRTDSHREAKGSDWIDVVWAAYENALVNAQLYWALSRWAEVEEFLGDGDQAGRHRAAASRLKRRFNQSTAQGGFWDPEKQCYIYWRNKDDSLHGANLVVPVNFSAIGYGLCDEPSRRAAVLDRIEALMQQEQLFFWPLCFFSFAKEEGHPEVNWPFPKYENGDIFLAWGELGTRAYSRHNPVVALKYVKNVLDQYTKDGLSFQRYLRQSQVGAGNDILANNCSVVVGLYRNIYGVQPKHDRLYLEPHLVPELNGTRLKYRLRGKDYQIDLNVEDYAVTVEGFTVRAQHPFAVGTTGRALEYFCGSNATRALAVFAPVGKPVELTIRSWPEAGPGNRTWTVTGLTPDTKGRCEVAGLAPSTAHSLFSNVGPAQTLLSDAAGRLSFEFASRDSTAQAFELTALGQNPSTQP